MLDRHAGRPEFLQDVLGDNSDEFEMIVSGVLIEWEKIADTVPGRYTALAVDNLPSLLEDAAGLRALHADLEHATEALADLLAHGSPVPE